MDKFRKIGRPESEDKAESLSVTMYKDDFRKLAAIRLKRGYRSDSEAVRSLIQRAKI